MTKNVGSSDNYGFGVERLGSALASGELTADGIVVASTKHDYEPAEVGQVRALRPEVWRSPLARDAVTRFRILAERLPQDGFVLLPIIHETVLFEWDKAASEARPPMTTTVSNKKDDIQRLPDGVHGVPAGYVTFDQINLVTRAWPTSGKIAPDLMVLLNPPYTDAMTQAIATGSLRAFGIDKRTGAIIPLPPSIWSMEVNGALQSIWAIGGQDLLAGPDGDPCLPVITSADLARCFQATEIPPDPDELPDGWQPAVPLEPPASDGRAVLDVDAWMLGLAQGYKNLGKTLKREDAVKAAMTHLRCRTRRAEAAFQALPYPDLRNAPRTPVA